MELFLSSMGLQYKTSCEGKLENRKKSKANNSATYLSLFL
jgi:hypothetical protein